MKVLFWVPYPSEGASNRYRVEQFLPFLKKNGIGFRVHVFWSREAFRILYKKGKFFSKFCYFLKATWRRVVDLINISEYDLVFIHRESFPLGYAFFEKILSLIRKPYIFDFDDAIFLASSSPSNSFIEKLKNPNRVKKVIQMAAHIVAGNRYLADFASRYNNSLTVIPTCIDEVRFAYQAKRRINGPIVIGWIGSVTTVGFLDLIKPVLKRLFRDIPDLRFKVVGGNFLLEPPFTARVINKAWSLDEELGDLMSIDIGIMPMPDNEWTRGKCAFKAIMYMSMGIPCVCSAVGVNKDIIQDGINGFLASTEEEWYTKLSMLIKDEGLSSRIGFKGRKTVEENFSLAANADNFIGLLKSAHG